MDWELMAAGAAVVAGAGAFVLWPSRRKRAGYPFARRLAGVADDPLWHVTPARLGKLSSEDAERLERALVRLDGAVRAATEARALLATTRIEDLFADDRRRAREIWCSFLVSMLAVDALKRRYEGWYGIDWWSHPELHGRAFSLTLAALCAEVDAGHEMLLLVGESELVQSLFEESVPEIGMPAGSFGTLRESLARTRDHAFVSIGTLVYDEWIASSLRGEVGERLKRLVAERRERALARIGQSGVAVTIANKAHLLRGDAFAAWFPVQKEIAEWFGDTRVVPEDRRLVSDAQLVELGAKLQPGDILIERRNWYLSNLGLPGFWPHAAIYTGTQDEIRAAFDGDPEVRAKFAVFSEHLARAHPAAWSALAGKDAAGHPARVLEAVSEGVIVSSLEHSCGADYVAALRPRLQKVEIAQALDRAFGFFGRPYDFNFNFATDDAIVCSELVVKAYEPAGDDAPGLRIPYVTIFGRRAIPPTEIVRVFAAELGRDDRQLDFVHFLDGREESKSAVVADDAALAASAERAKWDVVQP